MLNSQTSSQSTIASVSDDNQWIKKPPMPMFEEQLTDIDSLKQGLTLKDFGVLEDYVILWTRNI